MKNQLLVTGLIVAVVVASGCVDDPEEEEEDSVSFVQTAGVEISNFEIIPDEIPDTQNADLILELENVGESDAENVEAEIFNVQFGDRDQRQWEGQQSLDFGVLDAGDVDQNIDGQSMERMIPLTPPDLQSDESDIPYSFGARISYDYSTTATTEFEFMSQDRFYDQDRERTDPTVDNSAAPIQIDVQTSTPFVFEQDRQIQVDVQNVGQGTPKYDGEDDTVLLDVRETGGVSLEPREGDLPVELDMDIRDSAREYFTVETDFEVDDNTQRTVPISFVADYEYEKEEMTTVTVDGR